MNKVRAIFAILSALYLCPPTLAQSSRPLEPKGPMRMAAPTTPRAFETPHGWVITDSPRKAEWAKTGLDQTVALFQRHFDVVIGKGVIVETRYAGFVDTLVPGQRAWTLPWRTNAFDVDGHQASARRDEHHLDGVSSLRHELAHAFFLAGVIPNLRKNQYGGDAPDWLDEAAAMIVETDGVNDMRRSAFNEQVCSGRLIPLDVFLVSEHPVFAAPKMHTMLAALRQRKLERPVMLEMRLSELGLDERAVRDFYAQASAFAQYLVTRTGDEKILGRIAQSIRASGEPTSWQQSQWFRAESRLGTASLGDDFARWAHTQAAAVPKICGVSR